MKKIIAIISLVLVLALSLTACGGKKDYKEDAKTFEFDGKEDEGIFSISLPESCDSNKREIKEKQDDGKEKTVGITFTTKSFTSITVMKEAANTPAYSLANTDLDELKKSIPNMENVNVTVNKITVNGVEGETAEVTTKAGDATYYVYTVKDSTGEYSYLKAFLNKGEYSYSITFSATKAAYDGSKNDDGYKKHFVDWLKTADITIPESSEGN